MMSRRACNIVIIDSGYGIHRLWLRYSPSLVTVFTESGYGIHRVWLRYSPSLVTVFTESGYGIHRVWLRYSPRLVTVFTESGYGIHRVTLLIMSLTTAVMRKVTTPSYSNDHKLYHSVN